MYIIATSIKIKRSRWSDLYICFPFNFLRWINNILSYFKIPDCVFPVVKITDFFFYLEFLKMLDSKYSMDIFTVFKNTGYAFVFDSHLLQDMWSQPLDFWMKTWHFGQRHAFRTGWPRFLAHIFNDLSPLQNSLHVKPWCQGAWQEKHQTNRHFEHVTFITSGLKSLSCSVFANSGWW